MSRVGDERTPASNVAKMAAIPAGKWRDWFEERAAILEFMGNMNREQAEAKARWMMQEAMRKAGE